MVEVRKQWNIDFCQDNLRVTAGATEAIQHLKKLLSGYVVTYTEQGCVHACGPCHAGALIVRVNDELLTGSSDEVIETIVDLVTRA